MLFDVGTPDTSVYMIAGYAVFFVVTLIYLASVVVRTRNLHRDLDSLETLEKQEPAPVPQVTSAIPPAVRGERRKPKPQQSRPAAKTSQVRRKPAKKPAKKK